MISYSFKKGNGSYINISTAYNVMVEKSDGIIGKPSMKSVESFDWKYLHGSTPNLRNRRYENKEITLTCWMPSISKQKMVEDFNAFIGFFAYDNLILMRVGWNNSDGNQFVPLRAGDVDPHASKYIFNLVYLKKVSDVEYRFRYGKQIAKFKLTFVDPYPMKTVYKLVKKQSSTNSKVNYNIISESEIDIYNELGDSYFDILNGSSSTAVNCGFGNHILVCGDVVHAIPGGPHAADTLVTPDDPVNEITTVYSEI